MSVTSGFFNSFNGDRKYNAEQMSAIFDGIINDGVFASVGTAFSVSADSGNVITVGTGRAWFNGTWVLNDAILSITADDPDILLNRFDAVVIEVDHTDSVRAGDIKIVKGTPASSPHRPTMENTTYVHQYPLAYIYRIASSSEIKQANITNMIGTVSCPYVTGILETVTMDAVVSQWEDQWNQWFERIINQTEEEIGNALNKKLEDTFSDFVDDELFQTQIVTIGDIVTDNGWTLLNTNVGDNVEDDVSNITSRAGYFFYIKEIKKGDLIVFSENIGYLSYSLHTDSLIVVDQNFNVLETDAFTNLDISRKHTFLNDGILYLCAKYPTVSDTTVELFQIKRLMTAVLSEKVNVLEEYRSRILWSGAFTSGTISFFVPENQFHNNAKNLTLVVEGTIKINTSDSSTGLEPGDNTTIVSLTFNTDSFGDDNPAYPFYSTSTASYAYSYTDDMFMSKNLVFTISVRKLNTTDYALCTVSIPQIYSSYDDRCITCIYAIVPYDLQEE